MKMTESENSDAEFQSDVDSDSDTELQNAFQRGDLKPGLHALVPLIKKEHINDVDGMKQKLSQFKNTLDWNERLDLTNKPVPAALHNTTELGDLEVKITKKGKPINEEDDVHNDFKREMMFYRQAQAAVLQGIPKLHKLGITTKRPEDYFAQMAKSDEHMQKIRETLLSKEKALERSEKAKKLRELKKYGKQIQREVLQQRQKEKKQMMDSVKKYKKGQKDSLDFADANKNPKGNKKKMDNKNKNSKSNLKREHKVSKYGYGGQKKRTKYNTAESAADVSSTFRKGKSKGNGPSKNRPGKARRQKMVNRKRR